MFTEELTVGTINVRGIRYSVKQRAVFSFLHNCKCNIYFLQEVHLKGIEDARKFTEEWGRGGAVWSVGGVFSSGVGILFWDQEIEVENHFTVSQGRVVGADIKWKGGEYRLLSVYPPQIGEEINFDMFVVNSLCH